MSSCCQTPEQPPEPESCCENPLPIEKQRRDWILLLSLPLIAAGYGLSFRQGALPQPLAVFAHAIRELVHLMWWGLALGILAVGLLRHLPQRTVQRWLGEKSNFSGLARAVVAGVVFDLCSHGILLVSMQLYRKGLSLGQTMAFLIASPWNSFSLTVILFALVGWKWTAFFILASVVIAFVSGLFFDAMERNGVVPSNPYRKSFDTNAEGEPTFTESLFPLLRSPGGWKQFFTGAINESRMIIRWILFGIVLAAITRVLFSPELFASWFGPTATGLALTLVAATLIEVCSEGSSPLAADLLNRAAAPGNAFAFLMAGVATDYTEIMSIRSTMKSWKIALLLPAISIPQILLIGWLLNRAVTF